MPTYTFLSTTVRVDHGSRYMEVVIDTEIGDIVNGVGEDELLECIGKQAAMKYFDLVEPEVQP